MSMIQEMSSFFGLVKITASSAYIDILRLACLRIYPCTPHIYPCTPHATSRQLRHLNNITQLVAIERNNVCFTVCDY
jgi:hypothetical protein